MSDNIDPVLQHTLSNLEPDDWVGRMVLAREAAFFPEAAARKEMVTHSLVPTPPTPEQAPFAVSLWCRSAVVNDLDVSRGSMTRETLASLAFPDTLGTNTSARGVSGEIDSSAQADGLLPASAVHHEPTSSVRLRCTDPSCKYTGTFSTQYEVDRHVATKHETDKRFWCCATGCIKGSSAPAFARSDKLTDHIRAVHARPDALFDCPILECHIQGTLHLEELAAHFDRAHHGRGLHVRSIVNAAGKRTCPLWSCRKSVVASQFVPHLGTHAIDDLASVSEKLLDQGYVVRGTDVHLQCLVENCGLVFMDQAALAHHITFQHGNEALGSKVKAALLRQCPSLANEHMFDYLRMVHGAVFST